MIERTLRTLAVPAPAKLNAFLHVTGRRSDGLHTLETLFVLLDWGDAIELALRDDGRIVRASDLEGVPAENDLAVRAARAMQRASGTALGVDIAVTKRIPRGAGLGGGSSDAASVLLALNRLWNANLGRAELARLALTLGADVPFFIFGEPAVARGIGEELRAVTVPSTWVSVIAPPVVVPTAAMFAAPELTRDSASSKIDVFSEGYGRNDLEPVALARFGEIAEALGALRKHAANARMTGSGGCVFASFSSEAQARAALAARPSGAAGFVARTLARHPLAGWA